MHTGSNACRGTRRVNNTDKQRKTGDEDTKTTRGTHEPRKNRPTQTQKKIHKTRHKRALPKMGNETPRRPLRSTATASDGAPSGVVSDPLGHAATHGPERGRPSRANRPWPVTARAIGLPDDPAAAAAAAAAARGSSAQTSVWSLGPPAAHPVATPHARPGLQGTLCGRRVRCAGRRSQLQR